MFKTKKFFVVLTQMVTGAGFALVALALQLPFFFASTPPKPTSKAPASQTNPPDATIFAIL